MACSRFTGGSKIVYSNEKPYRTRTGALYNNGIIGGTPLIKPKAHSGATVVK
jgi:hypothetical protein